MRLKLIKIKSGIALLVGVIFSLSLLGGVYAQQSSSSNYSVNELIFGAGGNTGFASANYSLSGATAGELVVGNPGSSNFQAFGGFQTTDVPFIELTVNATTVAMGYIDNTTTGTGNATFSIRTYLASGYSITSSGGPPQNTPGDQIPAMTSTGASSPGTSQFGFNLTTNTVPTTFGADPVQVPSSSFSFGQVDNNYDDSNQYRYNTGEQIAFSNSSSGQTDFTLSYIMNVSGIQAAGLYEMTHAIIATSTF